MINIVAYSLITSVHIKQITNYSKTFIKKDTNNYMTVMALSFVPRISRNKIYQLPNKLSSNSFNAKVDKSLLVVNCTMVHIKF